MIELGKMNTLEVVREEDRGFYLDAGDEVGDILMPIRESPEGVMVGVWVSAFIYRDSQDRLIATTKVPKAMVGEFAVLEVTQVTPHGAFLDWGLVKDLMLPFGEQKRKVSQGRNVVVYVYVDEQTDRIAATTRLGRYLGKSGRKYLENEEVNLTVVEWSDLGYRVLVEKEDWGLVYHNQIFQPLTAGQQLKGFVELTRPDGKLDIVLQKGGPDKVVALTTKILDRAKADGGFLDLGDRSDASDIMAMFGVSKKTYKKALGQLFKEKKVLLVDGGVKLI